jgi:hypothetical protein
MKLENGNGNGMMPHEQWQKHIKLQNIQTKDSEKAEDKLHRDSGREKSPRTSHFPAMSNQQSSPPFQGAKSSNNRQAKSESDNSRPSSREDTSRRVEKLPKTGSSHSVVKSERHQDSNISREKVPARHSSPPSHSPTGNVNSSPEIENKDQNTNKYTNTGNSLCLMEMLYSKLIVLGYDRPSKDERRQAIDGPYSPTKKIEKSPLLPIHFAYELRSQGNQFYQFLNVSFWLLQSIFLAQNSNLDIVSDGVKMDIYKDPPLTIVKQLLRLAQVINS